MSSTLVLLLIYLVASSLPFSKILKPIQGRQWMLSIQSYLATSKNNLHLKILLDSLTNPL